MPLSGNIFLLNTDKIWFTLQDKELNKQVSITIKQQ